MPIEMPLGLPFVVDTWGSSSRRRHHHFLTHAHSDHLTNAQADPSDTVYATDLTMRLALQRCPQLERGAFVEVEVGKRLVVGDPDGDFSVTAYDANHCPGAVMFLFEGPFGSILHTGDCRLTSDVLRNLPLKGEENICRLADTVYLDCTFSKFPMFPSKESAINQVIDCILKHQSAPLVYLACERLGHEEILVEVSRTFGSKIYVDRGLNFDYFNALSLTVPDIIIDDPNNCRFQIVGLNQLKEISETKLQEAGASRQPEPLLIRPSALWYASGRNQKPSLTEAEQDDFGVWRICFSTHSSRDELDQALQILQPQWVISTTPPNFANELSYVMKRALAPSRTQGRNRAQEDVPASINFCSTFTDKKVYQDFVQRIPFSGKSPRVVEIDKVWVDHRTFGLSMRVNSYYTSEHAMNMMGQAIMSEQRNQPPKSFFKHVMHSKLAKMLQGPFQNQENISDDLTVPNQGYKLDDMDAVFVPLLMCKTWYLVVANFWKKRFEVLSPLGYTDELIRQAQSVVCNFQEAFHAAYPMTRRVKIKEMDTTFHTISNSDNKSDSGIFIMKALDLYDGEKQILFKDSEAEGLREHLTFYLLGHKYNEKALVMYKG